jgi:capsular polysaccharide transport system permease protein
VTEPSPEIQAFALRPPAGPAVRRPRHGMLLATLILAVVVPTIVAAWYMFFVAADQYHSTVGFTVRSENATSSLDVMGTLSTLTGGSASSSDTDVLNQFIQSQEMVAIIDRRLDLRAIYSRPEFDPVFSFRPGGSIEDLLRYWGRMVSISYDARMGLIEVTAFAFDPDDAQAIATAVLEESARMINALAAVARADATRYAEQELAFAIERLKAAREAVTEFRSRTQLVDPNADIQGQMGLLNTLQAELANQLIEYDLLRDTAREGDPRVEQALRRIAVIEARIAEERRKFSVGGIGPGGEDYATLVAEFERLTVDREVAEESYKAALIAVDTARAEAQRQNRYLAAFVNPTRAERSDYPSRLLITLLTALFSFIGWAVIALIYYSIRDRR